MKGERGFALVLALVITAILVALVTEFITEVYVDTSSRQYAVDAQQASLLAESGMTGSIKLLQRELGGQNYSSLQDRWATPLVLEEEKGSLRVTVEEENGKLSLNHVALPNGTFNEAYYGIAVRLLKKLGLSPDLCDTLADWVDENEEPHPGGAESAWYMARKPPYHAKNSRLETLEELALVKGFSGKTLEQLRPFVTVYADDPAAPAAPININTAPRELLLALDDRMTDALADSIIEYRKTTPFKSPAELTRVSGMETIATGLQTVLRTKGSVYRLRAEATVNGTIRVIEAVVRPTGPTVLYWREY
ncbi:type II secretion system minor pseudopilin GspK [Geobacter argillaceus]|uniref:General secretion pathway protein K n=1 Tax=Geobacter argillaceus TaxID=345631 RepID=A0A562WSU0_9BACT|nr:type II secretion system minor pseudopilin GspK [Geobacter argillaceus]TWJ33470.1 general secretion pathway protein K [Geobacter argillaceus]